MFHHFETRVGHYALLSLVWACLFLPNLGAPSLWDIDEGHNAEAAREMLAAGNVVVPTFNYRWRSDKPALLYWLQMAAYQLFGVNERSARLPSALAALGAILLTYELGRRLFTRMTGLLAGLILASSVAFCAAGHFANPDALLLAFSTLTLLLFWHGYATGSRSWFVTAGISVGLAGLAKGPVGLVLPGAVIGLFLLWSARLRMLWDWRLVGGVLAAAVVALPWYIAVIAETKGVFYQEFFLKHNAGRFSARMEGHGGPWFYYLVCLIVGLAPWSVFLGPTVASALGRRASADRLTEPLAYLPSAAAKNRLALPAAYRFLWSWIAVYVVIFSASATKLPNYVLPVYPALALLAARFLDRWTSGNIAMPAWVLHTCFACLLFVGIGVSVGLLLAGGAIDASFLRGRSLPGLENWAFLGCLPILGAVAAWWFLRKNQRSAVIACLTLTDVVFTGLTAAGGAVAVDAHKAVRPLVRSLPPGQHEREVRIACFRYYQPSLVFYCGREVLRPETEADALELLRYPFEVYLFVPAAVWEGMEQRADQSCRIIDHHPDLYHGENIVLVTNR